MKTWFKREWSKVWSAWCQFWFEPKDLTSLGLFRLVFGLVLFVFYLGRLFDYEFLFTDRGMLPLDVWNNNLPEVHESPIPWRELTRSPTLGMGLHLIFVVGLLALALGWIGRNFCWLLFILHIVFINRNPISIYGADMVATCWLLYLSLTDSNKCLRIWPWGKRAKKTSDIQGDLLTTVGMRMIQIQLCVIYAFAGLDKAKGLTWWQGDAVWNALANAQLVPFDLGFFHHFPVIIALMSFGTVVWEVYFPFLVWVKPFRRYSLSFGAFLHLSIGLLMSIPFFSMVMVSSYILFLDSERLKKGFFVRKLTAL